MSISSVANWSPASSRTGCDVLRLRRFTSSSSSVALAIAKVRPECWVRAGSPSSLISADPSGSSAAHLAGRPSWTAEERTPARTAATTRTQTARSNQIFRSSRAQTTSTPIPAHNSPVAGRHPEVPAQQPIQAATARGTRRQSWRLTKSPTALVSRKPSGRSPRPAVAERPL